MNRPSPRKDSILLVLSRDRNDEIHIGDDIKIVVIQTGNKIKLGIQAPKTIRITRPDAIKQERKAA